MIKWVSRQPPAITTNRQASDGTYMYTGPMYDMQRVTTAMRLSPSGERWRLVKVEKGL
jgi:hypothetical protein